MGVHAGPQTIVVRQVIGERSEQKTCNTHVRVPRRKPAIEQIIDVFVKRLKITDVRLIHNKVIVCGSYEIKAIYVACLPEQPVHAVEVKRVRFTVDVPIRGACPGMDAEASVLVEFVDYDCGHRARPHWDEDGHYHDDDWEDADHGCDCHHHKPHCHKKDYCDQDNHHDCHHHHHHCCFRHFDVTVVLKVVAKVMTDREVVIYPGQYPGIPYKPKG